MSIHTFAVISLTFFDKRIKRKVSGNYFKPPSPVRVPSQRPLARVSRQSANDKGDNGMILGAVHRSPVIYFTADENPGKPHLENV